MSFNSTIRQKIGICPSCPSSSKPTPLIKGFCNSHYWQSIRVKSAEKKSLIEVPSERILKPKIATARKSSTSGGAALNRWFLDRRKELTGYCAHCGGKSCKDNDVLFKFSIAHIFQKAYFKSIATHPKNFIELCFFGKSCHTNFDQCTLDWTELNCFDTVIERFIEMYPSIAQNERRRIPAVLMNYIEIP